MTSETKISKESKISNQKFRELLKLSALATSYSTFLLFLYLSIVILLQPHYCRGCAGATKYLFIVLAIVFAIPSCFYILNIPNQQKKHKIMMLILPFIVSIFAVSAYYPENTLLNPLLTYNTILYLILFIFFLIILSPFFRNLYLYRRNIKESCIFIGLGMLEFFIYGSLALIILRTKLFHNLIFKIEDFIIK